MFTFGALVSAIALAPVAVLAGFAIVAVMAFNFVVRELMLAAWDLAAKAVSEIEVFAKDLVSEKTTSVVKEVTTK